MDQERYDIYFTGKIAEGVSEQAARQNLADLFNTSVDKIARLFNGKPQLLKRGMDKASTVKYKQAFEGAGLVIAFKKIAVTAPPPMTKAAVADENVQNPGIAGALTLAPAGSDVLRAEERRQVAAVDIDTSNIKLASAFMTTAETKQAAPAAPDTSHISVAETGADLLAEKPAAPAPLEFNFDDISVAPAGSDMQQLHEDLPLPELDISGITLAEPGADILPDKPQQPAPVTPNIDHLSLKPDS